MSRLCQSCETPLHGSNRVGICWPCQQNRKCLDCDTTVSYKSKGRCRSCTNAIVNRGADKRASMSVTMKRAYADPAIRAERLESVRKTNARMMQDPAYAERCRILGQTIGILNFAKGRTQEVAQKRGPAVSAAKLAHIHSAYRELYRSLRAKAISAPEAQKMVEDQQAADERNAGRIIAANENAMIEKHRRELASRY